VWHHNLDGLLDHVQSRFFGIGFVSGHFVPLATVLISPIIVNIFFVHAFLAPEGLPVAVFLVLANSFLAYYLREAYKPLLKA
jgi:putative oxidoreductase